MASDNLQIEIEYEKQDVVENLEIPKQQTAFHSDPDSQISSSQQSHVTNEREETDVQLSALNEKPTQPASKSLSAIVIEAASRLRLNSQPDNNQKV